jgi:hypothetical protein
MLERYKQLGRSRRRRSHALSSHRDSPSSTDASRLPDLSPDALAAALDSLQAAVLGSDPDALYSALPTITTHLSQFFVTDACWAVLADSEIIPALIACLGPDTDSDITERALACARCLLQQSPDGAASFVECGGLAAVLGRIHYSEAPRIVGLCLGVARVIARFAPGEALTGDPAWFDRFLQLERMSGDPALLQEFAAFLSTAMGLFPDRIGRLCKTGAVLLERSLQERHCEWLAIQESVLDSFFEALSAKPLAFLSLAVPRTLIERFGDFNPQNQLLALSVILRLLSVPDHSKPELWACQWRLLAQAVCLPFRLESFFVGLTTGNEKLVRKTLKTLGALFCANRELVRYAIDCGLPAILARLIDEGGFAVKLLVLQLIQTVCQYCPSDQERKPFIAPGFLELLMEALTDKGASVLHNAALTTVLALKRTFRNQAEVFAPFDEILETEEWVD